MTTRDAFGRVVDVQDNASLFTTCDTGSQYAYKHYTYEYDVLDNLTRVVDTGGNEVKFFYDSLRRLTELRDPDLGKWLYEYEPDGNLKKRTDGRNRVVHLQYDGLDRLKQQDYDTPAPRPLGDPSADVIYTYDENLLLTACSPPFIGKGTGRLTTRKEVNGNEVKYAYDRIGRVIVVRRTVSGDARCQSFAYDGRDRVTTVHYHDGGRADYEYNGPWLKRVYEGATNFAQFSNFTVLGQPGTLALGNTVQTTYTYATESSGSGTCQVASFRLCQLGTTKGGMAYQDQTYQYDVNGNVMAIIGPIGGPQTHTYDNNDRLWVTTGPVWNTNFGINEMDNLTYWPVVGSYAYPANQLGYGHHPHAVCATGSGTCGAGTPYTYDASGNMTGGAGRTLAYDTVNRLTSATTASGVTSFVYDGDGGRVEKTVTGGTTKTVKYFDKWEECETTGGVTVCTKYIWAQDVRLAMKTVGSGALSYYHADLLGSTALVTDGTGAQQETIQYYPFGEQWTDTGTVSVPYKYTGQEFDASTGLYFYKSRYYDAHLGRFIQPDTLVSNPYVPAAWNRYSYVMNNPLKYTDPTGHCIDTGTCGIPLIGNSGVSGSSFDATIGNLSVASSSNLLGLPPNILGGATAASMHGQFGGGLYVSNYAAAVASDQLAFQSATNVIDAIGAAYDVIAGSTLVQAGWSAITSLFGVVTGGASTMLPAESPWPTNSGFIEGTVGRKFLMPGEIIDRYGFGGGRFVSPAGTSFESRALRPGTENLPLNSYQVMKPFEVNSGGVAPWFGQPGLGTQYELPVSVNTLLKRGILHPVKP